MLSSRFLRAVLTLENLVETGSITNQCFSQQQQHNHRVFDQDQSIDTASQVKEP